MVCSNGARIGEKGNNKRIYGQEQEWTKREVQDGRAGAGNGLGRKALGRGRAGRVLGQGWAGGCWCEGRAVLEGRLTDRTPCSPKTFANDTEKKAPEGPKKLKTDPLEILRKMQKNILPEQTTYPTDHLPYTDYYFFGEPHRPTAGAYTDYYFCLAKSRW